MKKFFNIFILSFVLISTNILGVEFIKQADKISDFIPKDWKIIELVEGDLNKDGLIDAAIIIEDTNPSNFKEIVFNEEKFLLSSRAILVLFKNKNGKYTLVSKNNNGFITHDNLPHYFYDDYVHLAYDNAKINKNNTLSLHFLIENNSGGGRWVGKSTSYVFRWQNNCFELIGYEHGISQWGSPVDDIASFETSINFSTNKVKETTTYWTDNKADKVEWKNLKSSKKFILDELEKDVNLLNLKYN